MLALATYSYSLRGIFETQLKPNYLIAHKCGSGYRVFSKHNSHFYIHYFVLCLVRSGVRETLLHSTANDLSSINAAASVSQGFMDRLHLVIKNNMYVHQSAHTIPFELTTMAHFELAPYTTNRVVWPKWRNRSLFSGTRESVSLLQYLRFFTIT